MYTIVNVPMIDVGIAKVGMIVARKFLRNSKITSTTRITAMIIVLRTSLMESLINMAEL